MRLLLCPTIGCMLAMSCPVLAHGQVGEGVSSPPSIPVGQMLAGAESSEAADPFASAIAADDVADPTDPFASPEHPDAARTPRLGASLDLMYQGTYLPAATPGADSGTTTHDVFLDSTLDWSVADGIAVGSRIVFNHEIRSGGQPSSHHGDVTALEYFYQQQFAGGGHVLTVGRKNLGWSSGFQWRPADLIDNGFSTKNIDFRDPYRYRGVNQVRYETAQEGFDFVGILANHDENFFQGKQFAAKLRLEGRVDFAVMYARNGDYSSKRGVVIDTGLPWGTTLAIEAVHVDVNRDLLTHPSYFGRTLESLSGRHSYEDAYVRMTKFIDDKRWVSFEFFHNGRGFDDGAGGPPAALQETPDGPTVDPSIFAEQYVGRNYLYAAYTGYIEPWDMQWKPSVLWNAGDESFIGSISMRRALNDNSELSVNLNSFHGGNATEFGAFSRGFGVGVSYVLYIL